MSHYHNKVQLNSRKNNDYVRESVMGFIEFRTLRSDYWWVNQRV